MQAAKGAKTHGFLWQFGGFYVHFPVFEAEQICTCVVTRRKKKKMPKCAFEGDKTSPNKENQRKFKYTMPLSGGPRILLHERGLQNKQGTTTITTTTTTTTRKVRHLSAKLLKNPQFWNTYIIVRSTLCRQC